MKDLLTFSEAAELCLCTKRTLRRAVLAGELSVVRFTKSSRSDRLHPDDVKDYIEKLRERWQAVCKNNEQKTQLQQGATHSTLTFITKAEQLDQLLATKSGKKS